MSIHSRLAPAPIALALALTAFAVPSVGRADPVAPRSAHAIPGAAPEVAGIALPNSSLARDATQVVNAAEGDLLSQHALRVYFWAALAGQRRGLAFDPDLLYVAALFHDYGLTPAHAESHLRFEIDGANAARDFLRRHGRSEADAQKVWLAIALHATNGVSPHLDPIAVLLAEGANMDLVGLGYDAVSDAERDAVERAFPRPPGFAELFLQALYQGLKHRPETTQGTGLADVMAYEDSSFQRRDFSRLMRTSPWVTRRPRAR